MASLLASEAARLQALQGFDLLDTAPEPDLDEVVDLLARLLQAPIALLSLTDANRQFFKARIGLSVSELPRNGSFCEHAIQSEQLFVVSDASSDARFRANPLVTGEPHIRFYAAMPLVTSRKAAIGTLCVIDTKPRALTLDESAALRVLGRQMMGMLERRRSALLRDAVLGAIDRELRGGLDAVRRVATDALSTPDLTHREGTRTIQALAAIEELDATVDAVADLLRLGLGGSLELRPARVDLRLLCSEVIGELAAGVGVRFEFEAEGDCTGMWDPERLQQAAQLLFEEARSRSPRQGSVQVSARAAGEFVLLEVKIPAVEGDTRLRIHLGRELIQAMGGKVDFRRESGTTTFLVCLPRIPPG